MSLLVHARNLEKSELPQERNPKTPAKLRKVPQKNGARGEATTKTTKGFKPPCTCQCNAMLAHSASEFPVIPEAMMDKKMKKMLKKSSRKKQEDVPMWMWGQNGIEVTDGDKFKGVEQHFVRAFVNHSFKEDSLVVATKFSCTPGLALDQKGTVYYWGGDYYCLDPEDYAAWMAPKNVAPPPVATSSGSSGYDSPGSMSP